MDTSSDSTFDPICGMWLEAAQVVARYTYIGRAYGFCSTECRDLFAQKPDVHVLRLGHDAESCIAHYCPHQRRAGGARDEPAPKLSRSRRIE